jgi:hypothetical protein
MADLSDMRMFSANIIPSEPIVWRVSSQPAVVQFKEEGTQELQHLGLPLSHNGESDLVVLWIGFRESNHELLVTLTIRLKIGSERHTRKQSSRRGRLMFLIVPVESLAIRCADIAYHALSNDPILAPILDLPSDPHSANSRVLKIGFDIGATRSFVIMPPDKVTGHQPGRSMNLLNQLKSHSEVAEFCLFTNHDRTLQQSVESVEAILDQRIATVITPAIELKAFYPGRRKAVVNLWEHQGWHQGKREENKDKGRSEGHHDDAPPYTRPCSEQQGVDTAGQCQIDLAASPPPPEYAPRASRTPVPATGTHLLLPSNQHDPQLVASNACDSSNPAGVFPVADSHDEHIFS